VVDIVVFGGNLQSLLFLTMTGFYGSNRYFFLIYSNTRGSKRKQYRVYRVLVFLHRSEIPV